MDQEWCPIEDFPGYSVSDHGLVRNDRKELLVARRVNNMGIAYVGLSKDGVQQSRSVAPLVAQAFLPPHISEAFDTPINLDGDRTNNNIWNLMWRPRWFAVKYHRQFFRHWIDMVQPLEEVMTDEYFEKPIEAATRYGLLAIEIFTQSWNFTYHGDHFTTVWPTNQRFRAVEKSRY